MPREEANSEVPGRGPIAASFKPVDPIVVFVYQSLVSVILMLSLLTVLIVSVRASVAPLPRSAAATVTVSLAEYPEPALLIVTPVTLPPTSIWTSRVNPVPVPPPVLEVVQFVCDPF